MHLLYYASRFLCYFTKSIRETPFKCHLHHLTSPRMATSNPECIWRSVRIFFIFVYLFIIPLSDELLRPNGETVSYRYCTRKLSHQLLPPTGGKNWKKNFILETRKEFEPDAKLRNFLSSLYSIGAISRKRNSKFLESETKISAIFPFVTQM